MPHSYNGRSEHFPLLAFLKEVLIWSSLQCELSTPYKWGMTQQYKLLCSTLAHKEYPTYAYGAVPFTLGDILTPIFTFSSNIQLFEKFQNNVIDFKRSTNQLIHSLVDVDSYNNPPLFGREFRT